MDLIEKSSNYLGVLLANHKIPFKYRTFIRDAYMQGFQDSVINSNPENAEEEERNRRYRDAYGSLTIDSLIAAVCGVCGITIHEFHSASRKTNRVEARFIYYYVGWHSHKWTLTNIARGMKPFRDHSTVIHGRDYIADQISINNHSVKNKVILVKETLGII